MENYIIIHGSFGSPHGNWFPWLKQFLESNSKKVYVPQFPIREEQNFKNWKEILDKLPINKNTTIIGHSIAPVFTIKYLKEKNKKIKRLISVAGFNGMIGNQQYDAVNQTFLMEELDNKIAEEIICFYSKDDPYVLFEHLDNFALELKAKQIIYTNAGHINSESGFMEFDAILQYI